MQILNIKSFLKDNLILIFMFFLIAFLIVFFIIQKQEGKEIDLNSTQIGYNDSFSLEKELVNKKILTQIYENEKSLPKELRYNDVNEIALKNILNQRNSILIDEPYFSTIISVSQGLDINPLFMFAVLGQEQGFVPRDNIYALDIANNPFNVFGSWQKYNTNIKDSSEIAARTLINLSSDRPEGEDPIKWINLRDGKGGYAEDKNWWIGVKLIFEKLKKETK